MRIASKDTLFSSGRLLAFRTVTTPLDFSEPSEVLSFDESRSDGQTNLLDELGGS